MLSSRPVPCPIFTSLPSAANFLAFAFITLEQNKMPRKLLQESFPEVTCSILCLGNGFILDILYIYTSTPNKDTSHITTPSSECIGGKWRGCFLAWHLFFRWVLTGVIINYTHFVVIKLHASMYSKFGGDFPYTSSSALFGLLTHWPLYEPSSSCTHVEFARARVMWTSWSPLCGTSPSEAVFFFFSAVFWIDFFWASKSVQWSI